MQTGADGAETIIVLNGSSNSTVTNAGTILRANAVYLAIYAKSKNGFLIDNHGTITGSLTGEIQFEGGSASSFRLQNHGLLNCGATITLRGDTAMLYSEGTISPGTQGLFASTEVSVGLAGNLETINTYLADFNPSLSVATGIVASDMLSLTVGAAGGGGLVTSSGSAVAARQRAPLRVRRHSGQQRARRRVGFHCRQHGDREPPADHRHGRDQRLHDAGAWP